MITNVHTRDLKASTSEVGALIDSLASQNDRLWAVDKWGPIFFDRPLGIGAHGGHSYGSIRYDVDSYIPGWYVRFRFTYPAGYIGTHAFDMIELEPGLVRLRHIIIMNIKGNRARFLWFLAIRWLHDAHTEDNFDKAEASLSANPVKQYKRSLWVRFLLFAILRNAAIRRLFS